MLKKILTVTISLALLFAVATLLTGCNAQLDYPKGLDIETVTEEVDGEQVVSYWFKWDKVDGAQGYVVYFNEDLDHRFFITDTRLIMNESRISGYLKSNSINSFNICAVNLDKHNYPVNNSQISQIRFNFKKKLEGSPTNLTANEDGTLKWGIVENAKTYKALVKDADDPSGNEKEYDMAFRIGNDDYATGSITDLEEGDYLVKVIGATDGYEPSDPSTEVEFSNYSEEHLVKWEVTFDYGYEGAESFKAEAYNGRRVTAPIVAEREGYEFNGWFEDDYLMFAAQLDNLAITAPTTFYAKWTKIAEEGGEDPGTGDDPGTGGEQQPPQPPQPEVCEYHFDGDGDGLCDKCGETVEEFDYTEQVPVWDGTLTIDVNGVAQLEGKDVYVYVWYYSPYSSHAENAEWPGQKATPVGNGKYTVKTDTARSIVGVIVNDGGGWQTEDINRIPDDHIITKDMMKGPEESVFTVDATGVTELENAENVYVYIWWEGGENAPWPGKKMTKGAGTTYTASTTAGNQIKGLIVSNGSWQSRDITEIPADHIITKDHIYGNGGDQGGSQPAEWDGTVTVDISQVAWFENNEAKICIHVWYTDDTHNDWDVMTKGADGKYTVKLDNTKTVKGIVIARINPSAQPADDDYIWNQTVDVTDFSKGYTIVVKNEKDGDKQKVA